MELFFSLRALVCSLWKLVSSVLELVCSVLELVVRVIVLVLVFGMEWAVFSVHCLGLEARFAICW